MASILNFFLVLIIIFPHLILVLIMAAVYGYYQLFINLKIDAYKSFMKKFFIFFLSLLIFPLTFAILLLFITLQVIFVVPIWTAKYTYLRGFFSGLKSALRIQFLSGENADFSTTMSALSPLMSFPGSCFYMN